MAYLTINGEFKPEGSGKAKITPLASLNARVVADNGLVQKLDTDVFTGFFTVDNGLLFSRSRIEPV